jgi:hypothetical protein
LTASVVSPSAELLSRRVSPDGENLTGFAVGRGAFVRQGVGLQAGVFDGALSMPSDERLLMLTTADGAGSLGVHVKLISATADVEEYNVLDATASRKLGVPPNTSRRHTRLRRVTPSK